MFDQDVTYLEMNSCNCRLIPRQVVFFPCDNVVSNDNLRTFVPQNILFQSDNTSLHDAMLTKVQFFHDRTGVWKKWGYELIFFEHLCLLFVCICSDFLKSWFYFSYVVCNTTNASYSVKKLCKHAVTWETSYQTSHYLCQLPKYIALPRYPYCLNNRILRDPFSPTSNLPVLTVCFPFLIEILICSYYENIKTFNRIQCVFVSLCHGMVCVMNFMLFT